MEERIGRYQVLEEIASGGQATVFRVFDPQTGQIVALKVLHVHLTGDSSYVERFRREASMAASIVHDNVVRIFEVGEDERRHYIALEFFPENLARVIESGGPMRTDRAAAFGVQIADGLAAAHALGIVHRDVKPQNVLIGQDGSAKVTDFGIARAELLSTMTATGAVMGTPHYMSPEQARGERADARSDVYSLGCVIYQMLTGEVPFKGETPLAVLRQHIEEQPSPVRERRRDVPRGLTSVVERAMAKDPGRRYQNAGEMAEALRASAPGLAEPAWQAQRQPTSQPSPPSTPPTPRRRDDGVSQRPTKRGFLRPLFTLVFIAAAVAIGVGAFLLTSGIDPSPPENRVPLEDGVAQIAAHVLEPGQQVMLVQDTDPDQGIAVSPDNADEPGITAEPAAKPQHTLSNVKTIEADWIITKEESYEDTNLEVHGRVIIEASGMLELKNSRLVLDPSGPDSVIDVRGGELSLDKSQLRFKDSDQQYTDNGIVVAASGGVVRLIQADAPHGLILVTQGTHVEILDSILDARGPLVEVHGGELSLKDSVVSKVQLDGGSYEIIDSTVESVDFTPTSDLDLIDSVVSAFNLNMADGGDFLVSGLGASREDGPSIQDLGSNEIWSVRLDGTQVEEWNLGIAGGSVTIGDSIVSYLLSQDGSDVSIAASEIGIWELRGTGYAEGSEIATLALSGTPGTPLRLDMVNSLVERLQTLPLSDGGVLEAHISCDGCQIGDSITLRNADFLLEGNFLIRVPDSKVVWENSKVTRLFPVAVMDEDGRPMAGVKLGITAVGASNIVIEAKSDDTGRAVFELVFLDSDWFRIEVVTSVDGGHEVREPLTFLSSTPFAFTIPSSGPAVSSTGSPVSTSEDDTGSGFIDCMVRVLGQEKVNTIFENRLQVDDEERGLIEAQCLEHLFPKEEEPVIQVLAHIDGRSHLAIREDTVQWFHFDDAAPGREAFANLPTIVNGVEWMPGWPDNGSAENRDCGCSSSMFRELEPALAADEVSVDLEILQARGEVFITEMPSVDNNYTLVVEFNDDPSGPDWYEIKITYELPVKTAEIVAPVTVEEITTPVTVVRRTEGGLRRGATISGRVVSAATGLPLTRIRIVADPANGEGSYDVYVVKTSGTKGEPLKRATWTLTGSGSSQICQPPFG